LLAQATAMLLSPAQVTEEREESTPYSTRTARTAWNRGKAAG